MPTTQDYRSLFVGLDVQTPLLNGDCRCYTNFDNAASTPPLKAVQKSVDDFLVYYSSVHRGTGFKSQLSTHAYEHARHITVPFVGADPRQHTCIFGKNTTSMPRGRCRAASLRPAPSSGVSICRFAFSVGAGSDAQQGAMRLKGVADFAGGDFPLPGSGSLDGWALSWRDAQDPAIAGAANARTLDELRAAIQENNP